MSIYLDDQQQADLFTTLSLARHSLTYPMMMPEHEQDVRRIDVWMENLRSPEQRARVEAMRARLAQARTDG